MGMDPDDILSFDTLASRDMPHTAKVVRCGCGYAGCGSVNVKISSKNDFIIWDCWSGDQGNPAPPTLIFEKKQYLQALAEAISDKSWESPGRTAARLLSSMLDHDLLAINNLKFQWASGRIKKGNFTISLAGPQDCHQILVHLHWNEESPQQIAEKMAELLKQPPSDWPDVVWHGADSEPPFNGAGWSR